MKFADGDADWKLIRDFPLDDPRAERPFSVRLRDANDWTDDETKARILEYRKFMYLRKKSCQPVTPSVEVDSVWHMHILYLRNYLEFCREAIGFIVYHDPGGGGKAESDNFRGQYISTVDTYRKFFGEPPEDIWGNAPRRLDTGSAGI